MWPDCFRYECGRVGIHAFHGHRHLYAQTRYHEMTGWQCPARGGPTSRQLTRQQKAHDREARATISHEMGHGREQITAVYLGRQPFIATIARWYRAMNTLDLKAAAAFLHIHPVRHTAITHMVQALVNLPTVKIFSGHKTLAMVERYAHASTAHGQASLDKLEARYRSNASTVAPSATHAAAGPKQGSKHG